MINIIIVCFSSFFHHLWNAEVTAVFGYVMIMYLLDTLVREPAAGYDVVPPPPESTSTYEGVFYYV